jgi:hypothetical protein
MGLSTQVLFIGFGATQEIEVINLLLDGLPEAKGVEQ